RFGVDFQDGDEQIAKPQAARRLSSRQAFDTYAGAVVDNVTGEVMEDHDQSLDPDLPQEINQAAPSPRKDATSAATTGGESKGAGAKT
ncbi:hypothetical protein, partial [Streptococcus suis]|uniref:hypothetical protein n=1 Tax=Streptococcus suis TaxID=1307 RepID=UPI003790FF00